LGIEYGGNRFPQLETQDSSSSYFRIEIVLTKFCSVVADTYASNGKAGAEKWGD
jgi:hypothetical protein